MATAPFLSEDEQETGDEESPDGVSQRDDPPTYGEKNRELPKDLKDKLEALVKKLQDQEMYDRRVEVLLDRILRFYYDGIQHVYPNWATGVYQVGQSGGFVDIGNGQIITSSITNEAVDELGIKAKGHVTVVVKASDVMIGVD